MATNNNDIRWKIEPYNILKKIISSDMTVNIEVSTNNLEVTISLILFYSY